MTVSSKGPFPLRTLKQVCRLNYGDALKSEDRQVGHVKVFGSNGPIGEHDTANTDAPCLVVGRKGSFGKVTLSRAPAFVIDTAYYVDSSTTTENIYWLYYALSAVGLDDVSRDSAVPGLSRQDAYSRSIPWCSPQEQGSIARYLQQFDLRIARLIRSKRRLIALLNEEKQAIIQQAVTRGLDPAAALKPSGVEWLGDIPAHWGMPSLGSVSIRIQTGPFGSQLHAEDYVEHGVPVVNPSHILSGRITPSPNVAVSPVTVERLSRHRLQNGDLVAARRGELGRCAVVTDRESGWLCGTGSLIVRTRSDLIDPEFLQIAFSSQGFSESLGLSAVGSTMSNLSAGLVARQRFQLPALAEQRQIVSHIHQSSAHISQSIHRINREIDLIREYRTRLISDVVTGQLDVRDVQFDDSFPVEDLEVDDVELLAEEDVTSEEIDDISEEEAGVA